MQAELCLTAPRRRLSRRRESGSASAAYFLLSRTDRKETR